jgi:[CysO sulfur-carrier protein]-S-L-cysteine hydrolase
VSAVRLPGHIVEAIVRHARQERPNEACGLVVGTAHAADGGVALRYVPCRNAAASPSRYLVHRDDLLAVIAEVDRSGDELWGVVHSHVRTPAVPSATDIAEAAWPAAVYLLATLVAEDEQPLRAWRITDGTAREIALVVEPDSGERTA